MMLDTPQIVQTTTQIAAVIHLTVPRSDMVKVFGPAAGELMAALKAQGIKPEGPIFAHHLKMSADNFDFELGAKVATPVKTAGRVKPGELPAAKVAHRLQWALRGPARRVGRVHQMDRGQWTRTSR